MLNPVEYLYEGTPIDDFLEMQKPFDFKNFVECSGGRENLFDLITVCMSFPAMFRFVFDENTSAPFAACFALAQCKDCKIEEFEYNYESKKAECEEILQSADFSELNDRDKAFYMYCQRKGVFIQQESVDYLDTVYGHRMELVEQIQKMEKEALTDYYEQRLHDMAIKVNKLICLCGSRYHCYMMIIVIGLKIQNSKITCSSCYITLFSCEHMDIIRPQKLMNILVIF